MNAVGRRGVLVGGAAALTSCGQRGDRPSLAPSNGQADRRGATAVGPAPALPQQPAPRRLWRPGVGEVQPEVKLAAARAVEELGRAQGRRTSVVYPQYGGLLASSACVMVLAEQDLDDGEAPGRREITVDVRLERRGPSWVVTSMVEFGREVPRPSPTKTGARLLRGKRVDISGGAAADLEARRVSPVIEGMLLVLAREHRLSISVLVSGHPHEVFGTTGPSNHARGRAVDIWALDGQPVAGMAANNPALLRVLRRARTLGSDEIGGPVDPDGPGGAHFTNALHRDHIHIGFDL